VIGSGGVRGRGVGCCTATVTPVLLQLQLRVLLRVVLVLVLHPLSKHAYPADLVAYPLDPGSVSAERLESLIASPQSQASGLTSASGSPSKPTGTKEP
jgi:hypothetical protein